MQLHIGPLTDSHRIADQHEKRIGLKVINRVRWKVEVRTKCRDPCPVYAMAGKAYASYMQAASDDPALSRSALQVGKSTLESIPNAYSVTVLMPSPSLLVVLSMEWPILPLAEISQSDAQYGKHDCLSFPPISLPSRLNGDIQVPNCH